MSVWLCEELQLIDNFLNHFSLVLACAACCSLLQPVHRAWRKPPRKRGLPRTRQPVHGACLMSTWTSFWPHRTGTAAWHAPCCLQRIMLRGGGLHGDRVMIRCRLLQPSTLSQILAAPCRSKQLRQPISGLIWVGCFQGFYRLGGPMQCQLELILAISSNTRHLYESIPPVLKYRWKVC